MTDYQLLILIVATILSFCIGMYLGKLKKKEKYNKSRATVPENSSDNKTDISENKPEEIENSEFIEQIIQECRFSTQKNIVTYVDSNNNIPKNKKETILKEIFKKISSIFFDEIYSICELDNYFCFREVIDSSKVILEKDQKIHQKKINKIGYELGLDVISSIFIDENFISKDSFRAINNAWEECDENWSKKCLIEYFCSNDGKKHWKNPEASHLIKKAIIFMIDEFDFEEFKYQPFKTDFEKEFFFHKILERNKYNNEDFHKDIIKLSPSKLERFFSIDAIADNDNDNYREFSILFSRLNLAKTWLKNTPKIYCDYVFSYLVWNNALPERFKDDNRYEEALNIMKKNKNDIIPNIEPSNNKESNHLRFIIRNKYVEEYLYDCIKEEIYPSSNIWQKENGRNKIVKMNQEEALGILNKNDDYIKTPYVVYSFIKTGYKINEYAFGSIIQNNLVIVAQTYFDMYNKELLN